MEVERSEHGVPSGNVLMDGMDVMDVGRMGIIQDPIGAVVSLWEPRAHIGANIVNEPNTYSWMS